MCRVAFAGRRIATQGDDVAHPSLPVAMGDRVHFFPRGADAGQMRGRHQAGFLHQAGHRRMGARLGGAAGTVGDRDEARLQRLQPADAGPKLLLQRLGLRRKELERQGGRLVAGTARGQRSEARAGEPAFERRTWWTRVCGTRTW